PVVVDGKLQIGARIKIGDGSETFLPLNVFVYPKQWSLLEGESYEEDINKKLDEVHRIFREAHGKLFRTGMSFGFKDVVRDMRNHKNREYMLITLIGELQNLSNSTARIDERLTSPSFTNTDNRPVLQK